MIYYQDAFFSIKMLNISILSVSLLIVSMRLPFFLVGLINGGFSLGAWHDVDILPLFCYHVLNYLQKIILLPQLSQKYLLLFVHYK